MNRKYIIFIVVLVVVTNSVTAAIFSSKSKGTAAGVTAQEQQIPTSPDIQNKIAELNLKCEIWPSLGNNDKIAAVKEIIKLFRERENSAILNPADYYVPKLDALVQINPPMLGLTLPTLVKIVTVMEYDFFNGQNKDELAKQVLGPQLYEENKKRLNMSNQGT